MPRKVIFISALIVLILIGACARRSTAVDQQKLLLLVSETPTVGSPRDLCFDDRYLYVAADRGGLTVIDSQDWKSRWWGTLYPDSTDLVMVRLASIVPEYNLLYLGEYDGADKMLAINVSDKDSLKLSHPFQGGTDNLRQMRYQAMKTPSGTNIIEGYFAAGRALSYFKYDGVFYTGHTWKIDYIPDAPYDFDITDNLIVIAAGQQGILVYDLATQNMLGRLPLPGEALSVKVSGNYAYLACRQSGFYVVDISNPSAPVLKGGYDTTGYATSVDIKDNLALVSSGGGGVYLFDITNPSSVVLKERLTADGYTNGAAFWKDKVVVLARDKGAIVYRLNQ